MKIKACGYYILVEIDTPETLKKSEHVYIPQEVIDRDNSDAFVGYVRDIGPTAYSGMSAIKGDTGEERAAKWGVKIGDKVEFTRYDGKSVVAEHADGKTLRFIQDQHIISVIED